ncbi:MAG: RNA-binding protein [Bacteroidales bacterium]|nr:RNA-binding protein [Bacteroidales bacterium]
MNIYVGNLSFKVKENDLKEIFEEYGEVSSVKIITDKFTGKSKGFAFVDMQDDDEAQNAIKELNGSEINDRAVVVNEAKPKPEGGASNNRGRMRR